MDKNSAGISLSIYYTHLIHTHYVCVLMCQSVSLCMRVLMSLALQIEAEFAFCVSVFTPVQTGSVCLFSYLQCVRVCAHTMLCVCVSVHV